jgi:hypothetical protein
MSVRPNNCQSGASSLHDIRFIRIGISRHPLEGQIVMKERHVRDISSIYAQDNSEMVDKLNLKSGNEHGTCS